MKISPNSAVAFAFVACAMIVTSCANDVETDMNVDPAGNAISFVPSVGGTTRATETTIKNLGDFAVIARGMHHDGVLYDNFLIGGTGGGEVAHWTSYDNDENPTEGTWKLDRSVYWPSSLNQVLFYAYTALKKGDTYTKPNVLATDDESSTPTLGFDGDNPCINGFKPLKTDVSKTKENGIWADGENQKDLLVAFTQQARATSAIEVPINFGHALTQISITAKQEGKVADDHRVVKIKGAWIVNAAGAGNLTSKYEKNQGEITKTWTPVTEKTTYGAFYTDIVELNGLEDKNLLREYSLMLIPENLTAWNCKGGSGAEGNNGGAYILLLCRVELKHKGTVHNDATETSTETKQPDLSDIAIEGGDHYHQLFPVNEEKFDGAQYGFVCVPLESDWNTNGVGKHYTYKLNICGNGTSAGKYPPTMSDDDVKKLIPTGTTVKVVGQEEPQPLIIVTDPASGKKVGDNVLDDPIQFTVKVSGWEEKGVNWTNGTANPSEDNN